MSSATFSPFSSPFHLEPQAVSPVQTPFRRIHTAIPAPQTLETLRALLRNEPGSMLGQPPIVWDRAEGCQIYDAACNMWLDFSSGVLVASAGHGRKEIAEAIATQARQPLLHNYVFPSSLRLRLIERLLPMLPPSLNKVFLLTTGSEAIECVIKLSRSRGHQRGGRDKNILISFEHGFHGRTLGAQLLGGSAGLKSWIVHQDPDFHQVPSPVDPRTPDHTFTSFTAALAAQGVEPDRVAAVVLETVQGGNPGLFPNPYIQQLARWCTEHEALLVFDEIQTAFGRTGRRFGFEHYEVVPDMIALGKAVTSSLPLAAVIGRAEIMDQFPPGSMTSTHSGSPIPVAATLANLDLIERENLVENAARMGVILQEEMQAICAAFPEVVLRSAGVGLMHGIHLVRSGTTDPAPDLALHIVEKAIQKGLMLFAPVGFGGAVIKVAPPLIIEEAAIRDGALALRQAFAEVLAG